MSIRIHPFSTETKDGRTVAGKVIVVELFGIVIELGAAR